MKSYLILAVSFFVIAAQAENSVEIETGADNTAIEELNPFDENIQQKLEFLDQLYTEQTGLSPFLPTMTNFLETAGDCYRLQCSVYARVVKAEQKLYLYINGRLDYTWNVSSGGAGHTTPDIDTHPNGRIYDKYTSTKFPEGDWNGLGNMPYVVFLRGGFAIHGTTYGNIPKLGTPASHGCVRLHPENGKIFNRLVRQHGVKDVWVTIE
ncbi:MAG: L,D-transpeptidase [Bdellovibrionaceae bacterium]|nr:L,D-transpeptidase [Bdellovibrio sp.]